MKNYFIAFCLLLGCASAFGFAYTQLLGENDVEFERIDNANGVALGSALKSEHPWGSYNQWQCFDKSQVELTCADYDYGTLVPSIKVTAENEVFLFDTYVENQLDCEETLIRWENLFADGKEVCIFAANMPDVDLGPDGGKPQSLWYINRIKGVGGYWNLYEESPEFQGDP